MTVGVVQGILLPFFETMLGAACVFVMRDTLHAAVQRALTAFAAGVIIYVVVEEPLPEASAGMHSNIGTLFFAAGFSVMLALDVAPG